VDSNGKFELLFAEGIDAAIEVKPDISSSAELSRGLKQGLSVKALRRTTEPTMNLIPWSLERSRRVPYIMFAMRCKADQVDTGREVTAFHRDNQTAPIKQDDFMVVNKVGIFMNFLDVSMFNWLNAELVDRTQWFFEDWREDALTGFLWRMQLVAHASIKLQDDVLPRYFHATRIRALHKIDPDAHPA
jgi:hypothetical protein